MLMGALGVVVAVLAAVLLLTGMTLGAGIGRSQAGRLARGLAIATATVGLVSGFTLVVVEVVTPVGIGLMVLGICALVTVTVQFSQPMADPEPIGARARNKKRRAAPISLRVVADDAPSRSEHRLRGGNATRRSIRKIAARRARKRAAAWADAPPASRPFWPDEVWPNDVISSRHRP